MRACLQSIMGAPVLSRSSFTCVAEIFTVVVPMIAFAAFRQIITECRWNRHRGPETPRNKSAKALCLCVFVAKLERLALNLWDFFRVLLGGTLAGAGAEDLFH